VNARVRVTCDCWVTCDCDAEPEEPVCDECGAPTAKDCECEAEQLEPDSDFTLGLRR
jgi:hypothetical protein